MKKKIAILLISFCAIYGLATPTYSRNGYVSENSECRYGQCEATAKSTGNRCKHCVSNEGDRYCYQHK